MNGYQCFQLYVAMKQHFTTKSFDIFKNRGHMKCKIETYLSRVDSEVIERIASKFTDRELVLYIASNMIYGNNDMIWNYGSSVANYNLFLARRTQIYNVVDNDLKTLYNTNISIEDGVQVIRMLTKQAITIETVSLINQIVNITDSVRVLPIGDMLDPLLVRIDKSKHFIKLIPGVENLIKSKLK